MRRVLFLGIALVAALPFTSSAAGFEVSGVISAEPNGLPKSEFRFRVRVAGRLWKIRGEPLGKSAVEFYEDAFDGHNIYCYEKLRLGPTAKGVNTSIGVIENASDIPCESSTLAPPLWLALCSSWYFESASTNQMPDLFDSGYEKRPAGSRLAFSRELHGEPPHLPAAVDLFSDGRAYSRNANGKVEVSTLPEPFDKGFRSAAYRVVSFTNVNGLFFPATFSLQLYLPSVVDAKSADDVTCVLTWRGEVTSIKLETDTAQSNFVPRTDGKTLTEDRRFPQIGEHGTRVSYLNTNNAGGWAEKKVVTKVYASLMRNQRVIEPVVKRMPIAVRKRALVATLVLLGCIPVVLVLVAVFRKARLGRNRGRS